MSQSHDIPRVHPAHLHELLGFQEAFELSAASRDKPLSLWQMETDDAPILRYVYRNLKPRRHLEFGTWQGFGATCCLEESDATVWTLNLPFGEQTQNGAGAYGITDGAEEELAAVRKWALSLGLPERGHYRTDTLGMIGRIYLEKGYGHRVCQIYCDSLEWNTDNYPEGFFDTVLIDGGHRRDIVINDTLKALPLLRSGGIMMWHDYCPPLENDFSATSEVGAALRQLGPALTQARCRMYWVDPSWVLIGIKA